MRISVNAPVIDPGTGNLIDGVLCNLMRYPHAPSGWRVDVPGVVWVDTDLRKYAARAPDEPGSVPVLCGECGQHKPGLRELDATGMCVVFPSGDVIEIR